MSNSDYVLSLSEIPEGYQVFEERLPISGVSFRKSAARRFIKSGSLKLVFERDCDNEHDKNAIMIYGLTKGVFRGRSLHIGFVPKETAKKIVESGFEDLVVPRLYKTYLGPEGYIEIDFQILGPKGRYYEYDPPLVEGAKSFTDYVPRIKQLKSAGRNDEAIELLLECVEWTERDALKNNCGVAPWYYEQLAILYRKKKELASELSILERYERQAKSAGVGPAKLAKRLAKVRVMKKH